MKRSRLIAFSGWLSADLRDHLRGMERSKLAHVHPDPDEERAVRLLVAWQEDRGEALRVPLDATTDEIRTVVRFLGELADKERGRAEGIRENGGQTDAVILRQQARSIALVKTLENAVSILLTLARPAAPPMPRSTRDYTIIPLSDPTELAVLGWHEAVADATYGSPAWDQDDPRDEIGTRALVSWSSNDEGQRQDYLRIPKGATRPTLEAAQLVVIHAASVESDTAEAHRSNGDRDAARLAQRAADALTALSSRIGALIPNAPQGPDPAQLAQRLWAQIVEKVATDHRDPERVRRVASSVQPSALPQLVKMIEELVVKASGGGTP